VTLTANWLNFPSRSSPWLVLRGTGALCPPGGVGCRSGVWPEADALARRIGGAAAVVLLIAAAFRLLAQAESFLDPGEYLSLASVRAVLSTAWGGVVVAGRSGGAGRRDGSGPAGAAVARCAVRVGDAAVDGSRPRRAERAGRRRGPACCTRVRGGLWARHPRRGALQLAALGSAGTHGGPSCPPSHASSSDSRRSPSHQRRWWWASGAAQAIGLVGSLHALRDTAYGQRLLLKLGLLVVLLATGAYNWRVVRPTLGTRNASRRLVRP